MSTHAITSLCGDLDSSWPGPLFNGRLICRPDLAVEIVHGPVLELGCGTIVGATH